MRRSIFATRAARGPGRSRGAALLPAGAVCAALAGLAPGLAGAQQTAAPAAPAAAEAPRLEEIIVTAEKRSESIQAVPSTMSAFSAADIRTRGIATFDDISRMVPSLNFAVFGYSTQLSARGVGMDLVAGEGESSVAIQLDGIPLLRTPMLELAQTDLSRIEFLSGPQGTLYGRNATGGVLNLITPPPPDAFAAGATVGAGNYKAFDASAYVGGPIADNVRMRLYAGTFQHDGYIYDATTRSRLEDERDVDVHLAIDADLTPRLHVDTRLFDMNGHSSGPVYKPIDAVNGLPPGTFDLSPWRIDSDYPDSTKLNMVGGSLRITYDLTAHDTLTSLTGYIRWEDLQSFDSDGTSLPLFYNSRPEHMSELSEEVDFVHESDRLKLALGAFFLREHVDDLGEAVYTPGFAAVGLASLGFGNAKQNVNEAVFGDATYSLTSKLSVFGGLRGIFDRHALQVTDSDNFVGGGAFDLCSPSDPLGNEASQTDALTGRAGARYVIDGGSSVYGSVSRGYKSGGFNPAACGNAYAPETLYAVEIGSKNLFFDRRLMLNLSAFYYRFKNLQVEQVVDTTSVIDNVPLSRIWGLDAEGSWKISRFWQVDGNLSLLHARYVTFTYLDQNTNINKNLAGAPLDRSPNWSLNFGAQYTQPFRYGAFLVRGDLYATARFALDPANDPADFQTAYFTLAGSVTWIAPDEKTRIRAWVKNATDRAILQGVFTITLAGIGREGIYGPPTTFGVEVTRTF
jgi:iron complex outermembrane receptor protein